jgi:mRNA-degrading endonuclease RelE of RelBE toxin-antitoxin system
MNYKIIAVSNFRKEAKKLYKKYPLGKQLSTHPTLGTALGNNCYKIRIAISSKGRGKSGDGRVISYVQVTQTWVYLLSIYDKSEKETISNNELQSLLNQIES